MTSLGASAAVGADRFQMRRQLVATILHSALAQQCRICVIGGAAFPREHELFGRDLSLLTLVEENGHRAATLRKRFSNRIVIETSPRDAFLDHHLALSENFDLVVIPALADNLADKPLSELLGKVIGCLRRGGRIAVLSSLPVASRGKTCRTLVELVGLFEDLDGAAGVMQLSTQICGELLLVEAKLVS